ncbi:uncharacterized protein LOC133144191 [Syngnathus typhle]|uniref:uncharacterized protein LOC133144191 n=1 Tax=Syngnathus typhle TaxID=161592 RepID=UPI002A6ACB0D|nr:uncharacterized protein LOC133144191 [Syngnathus typhle]
MEKTTMFVLWICFIFMFTSSTEGQSVTACSSCTSETSPTDASSQSTATTPSRSSAGDLAPSRPHLSITPEQPAASPETTSSSRVPASTPKPSPSQSPTTSARTSTTTIKAGTNSLFELSTPMLMCIMAFLICNV